MLFDKYKPLRAPEAETGATETSQTPPTQPPVPFEEVHDGPGSGRGPIRKALESSVAKEREGRESREKQPAVRQTRRSGPNHQEPESEVTPEATETPDEGEQPEAIQEAAPEGFSKEAKSEWANTPQPVRAAMLKREQDMAKGVKDLQARYSDIDQALAPRLATIRQHGHTPAQAVNQLFSWFEALSHNPQVAFPALAQSFRFDLHSLLSQQQPGQPQGQQQPGAGTAPLQPDQIPPSVAAYIQGLEERVGRGFTSMAQQFQQQSMAKTQETLDMWSKDKPYFEEVRQMMAHLISSQAVPPLANGAADLDKAYDMALYALPDVRTKLLAEQEQARLKAVREKQAKEKQALQQQAEQARRAAGGTLGPSAPGEPGAQNGKKAKGKSVRESLMEAREELSS